MYAPGTELTIGTLLVGPKVQLSDLAPTDMLSTISAEHMPGPPFTDAGMRTRAMRMRFVFIAEDGSSPFPLTSGAMLNATYSPEDAPKIDILLVPGPDPLYVKREGVDALLRRTVAAGGHVLAICSGCLPVAASGVLDGLPATGPPAMLPKLREHYPAVRWQDARRYERGVPKEGGQVWSSGTILNGIDAVAAFMREHFEADMVEAMHALSGVAERPVEYSDVEKSKMYVM